MFFQFLKIFFLFYSSRAACRAEVHSFLSPIIGEPASSARIRERIEFNSNILFLVENLYLSLGSSYVTTQAGNKFDPFSTLYWIRNQLASQVKELMIAKKTGWQVLKNLKTQQLSGEAKQMAKAIADAAKATAKAPSKKRPSSTSNSAFPTSLPPSSKRRSFKPDKVVVCYSCQQTGHIAPQCPNNKPTTTTSSSSSSKASSKK